MELTAHTLSSLFEQLGLDGSDEAIEKFISTHKPISEDVPLYEVGFWNSAQASFLQQAIADDADWAEVVDQLDSMLRK